MGDGQGRCALTMCSDRERSAQLGAGMGTGHSSRRPTTVLPGRRLPGKPRAQSSQSHRTHGGLSATGQVSEEMETGSGALPAQLFLGLFLICLVCWENSSVPSTALARVL